MGSKLGYSMSRSKHQQRRNIEIWRRRFLISLNVTNGPAPAHRLCRFVSPHHKADTLYLSMFATKISDYLRNTR